ncbi:hypothetical protein SK3146_01106 [Paenibacillus konkukensis]|uniref:Uncharacterized protein n=1 Tax=Paenibacillus konkukensis TaxID=2020716 RepID=A0ABY4RJZ7_9BACL|nr:hypothetical protein [Paenibacillus konkukensis]UQZ81949.1 hypothetical protein SK3146_01106 [Paenibacillus konkukensis]
MKRNEKPNASDRYEDLFLIFSSIIEMWAKRILILLLCLLVASQLLLQVPFLRYYMVKVEQLEGIPFSRSS